MRLHVFSDLHIEFGPFAPPLSNADAVAFAGDLHIGLRGLPWIEEHFPDIPVLYVVGNHEYYHSSTPKLLNKLRAATEGTNVRVLENDCTVIDGVRFFGCTLWTDFRLLGQAEIAGEEARDLMTDYRVIRVSPKYRKLTPNDTAGKHMASVRWLKRALSDSSESRRVVITHHAPSPQSVADHFKSDLLSASYASDLDDLVKESDAAFWIHGHMHESYDYFLGQTRVVCNPRGYADSPNPEFNPDLVLEI